VLFKGTLSRSGGSPRRGPAKLTPPNEPVNRDEDDTGGR